MKRCPSLQSYLFLGLSVSIGILSGCSATFNVPDTGISTPGTASIKGQVYGGHAPLVNAHIYLLQVGSGSLGASSTSLLGTGTSTSPGGYTLQSNGQNGNPTDPNIPVGWNYVVADGFGNFNLTGAYSCSANIPVYIYAYGGSPGGTSVAPPAEPSGFNPSVVNLATLGDCPTSDTFSGTLYFIYVNEVSTVATAYAFQGFTSSAAGHNDAVHIGYSGAVSTPQGLLGIQNAAVNASQLYDIAGSIAGQDANYQTFGTTAPNIGPNKGAGIVPQAVVDTVANILAACVDSGNTSASPNATCSGTTGLLTVATSDGTSSGTQAGDTATAAINIARHPAGGCTAVGVCNTTFVSNLFGSTAPTVPFTPSLTNQPPDFTIAINFPSSPVHPQYTGAYGLALDGFGYLWFTNWTTVPNVTSAPVTPGSGYFTEASPLGVIQTTSPLYSNALGNVTVDSNEIVWSGNVDLTTGTIYAGNGTTYTSYAAGFSRAAAPVADASTSDGTVYYPHGPTCPLPVPTGSSCTTTNNAELTSVYLGAHGLGMNGSPTYTFPAGAYVTHAAIDSGGYDWMTSDTPTYGNAITRVLASTAAVPNAFFPIYPGTTGSRPPPYYICGSGWLAPEQPAIDASGNAWIPIYGNNGQGTGVFKITATGSSCNFYATGTGPYGAAVDGANNVWITNTQGGTGNNGSLAELNATTGLSLSTTKFQPVTSAGANILNDPLNVAIDISGDVFITNYGGNSIVEFIGLSTPLYGPLGVAAGAGKIGTAP